MEIKTLYRYIRPDGGTTVSTEMPDVEYTETYRLIADEGMVLTQDDISYCTVVDTDNIDIWKEVKGSLDNE